MFLRNLVVVIAAVMTLASCGAAREAKVNQESKPASTQAGSQPTSAASSQPASQASRHKAYDEWKKLAAPVEEGCFVRPADTGAARPVWGHAQGLRVGIYPMRGPRGLLRIYAPYLIQAEDRVINYVAIEPYIKTEGKDHKKRRGYSELEHSDLDGANGKRFWAADKADDFTPRRPDDHPSRGVITSEGDVRILRVYVMVEPYDNGARVYVRLTFRSDRPEEVGIATFAREDSVPLDQCVMTATMGNFARIRELHLKDKVVTAKELWPEYTGNSFIGPKFYGLSEMHRTADGGIIVAATNDEKDPKAIPAAWQYKGEKATQYWRFEKPDPKLSVKVNGRFTYYLSNNAIPGGIAYENFELVSPFHNGDEFWFGVTKKTPQELGLGH